MECYYYCFSYLTIYSSSDSEPDHKNLFHWIQYVILELKSLLLTYSLSHLRTQLTVIQIIFDVKKLVKCYVSATMSIKRPWNFNQMYSNFHMQYEYVEIEVCEIMALSFACVAPLILTLRRLMSYIYGAPILDVSRSHTTTQHSR